MTLMTLIAVVSFAVCGCSGTGDTAVDDSGSPEASTPGDDSSPPGDDISAASDSAESTIFAYCGSCGHKDDAVTHICDEDHAKCEKCGLHERSELCCKKVEGDFTGKLLCAKCGEVLASDKCCQEGASKCEKCGLQEGSPLCCKLAETASGE